MNIFNFCSYGYVDVLPKEMEHYKMERKMMNILLSFTDKFFLYENCKMVELLSYFTIQRFNCVFYIRLTNCTEMAEYSLT